VDGDGRTRGTRRFERLDPHVVARGEHAHVGEEERRLHDLIERGTGLGEHGARVHERLAKFSGAPLQS